MSLLPQDADVVLGVAERRVHTRAHPTSLILVNLGNANAGIAFNLSESGLALAAAMILPEGPLPDIRIQFPDSNDWIEASGEIVWRSKSRKEAGVRFVNLADDALREIRGWISSNITGGESLRDPEPHREEQHALLQTPGRTQEKTETPTLEFARPEAAPEKKNGHKRISLGTAIPEDAVRDEIAETPREPKHDESANAPLSGPSALPAPSSPSADRRVFPRKPVGPPAYFQLGDANGGIVFNISEGGLALTAAMILAVDELPDIQIRFPGSKGRIEVTGRIVWRAKSKKEAGVRFLDLSDEVREKIRQWISFGQIGDDVEEQREQEQSDKVADLPATLPQQSDVEIPETWTIPLVADSKQRETSLPISLASPAPAPGLQIAEPPPPAPVASKSVRKRSERRALEVRRRLGRVARAASIRQRRWSLLAVIVLLIGTALVSARRLLLPPDFHTRIAQFVGSKAGDVKEAGNNGVAASPAIRIPISPLQEMQSVTTEPKTSEPALSAEAVPREPEKSSPVTRLFPPHDQGRRQQPPANLTPKTQPRPVENILTRGKRTVDSIRSAIGLTPPATKPLPPQAPSGPTLVPSPQAAKIVPTPDPPSAAPKDAPLVNFAEKPNALIATKPPELPPVATGSISVQTDPYPSIQKMVESNLRKSRKGKTLQLGHLTARVDPTYPEDAARLGIEGTVKIHALIGKDGSIENLQNVSGPSLLLPAATNAVMRWRYSATLLAGEPVETEEDVAITFRLAKSGAQHN